MTQGAAGGATGASSTTTGGGAAERSATVATERYMSDPGQALAYKIGELEIRSLRAEAERALGDRFDVRAFHDVVLRNGSIPLPTLRREVRAWIASGGRVMD